MITFNLNNSNDADRFARLLASFQLHGVEYRLDYEGGYVNVTPYGAKN